MPQIPWSPDALPQPEEAVFFLLTPDNKNGLTSGTIKVFFFRILGFILFFTLFKFLLIEYIPSFKESILIIVIFTLLTLFLLLFFINLNKVKNKIKPNILKKKTFIVPEVKPFLLSGVSRKNTASSGCGRASGLHGICGIKIGILNCL